MGGRGSKRRKADRKGDAALTQLHHDGALTQLQLVRGCIGEADWPAIARRLHLSRRQIQIMRLIIEEDLGNEALARRMGLKLRTVETHIQRLLEKLGKHGPEARSRTAACNRVWIAYWEMREKRQR